MGDMPTEPENGPVVGRDLTGYVLVPTRWVEHYEQLLEEREDAESVRILEAVKTGREQVFTHHEVWGGEERAADANFSTPMSEKLPHRADTTESGLSSLLD